jgi:AraC-like DNA-binding protein
MNDVHMTNLFGFLENNISENINTEILSSVGYVSHGKLKHDFYNQSGHPVKEYIRKRRLSNALALIKMSDMELTEIALHCGYSSHQALCRAVKQTLGLTPTEYKHGDTYYFFPPWSGEPLQSVTVSNIYIPRMSCFRFYDSKMNGIEDVAVNTLLQAFPNFGGRLFGRNGKQKGNQFCYEIYLTDMNIDYNDLSLYGFEASGELLDFDAVFATTTVRNNEQEINAAWNYLYSVWLQSSMFEHSGENYYEEYIRRNNKPYKLKLYLPIQKRDEGINIKLIDNPGLRFVVSKAIGRNAEETASRTVIDYLMKHCPHIINFSKETYIQKKN